MSADKTHELLPFNAPDVMRDVLKALNFDAVLDPGIDAVRGIKWPNPPDDFIPWLLHELSLSPFSHYRKNDRALYFEGRELNRLKGTKAAVRMVATWFGYGQLEPIEIRTEKRPGVHFPEFQLGLDKLPEKPTDLCDLLDAVNRVKPLRSRFRRVWHGYDVGMFIPSESRGWGDLLSDYSGIHSTDIGLCVSPTLCKQDLRISFRVYDRDWIQIEPEFGEHDRITVFDNELVRDSFNLPVLSQDFDGRFYPFGYGSVGEFETGTDNQGSFMFDGNNREWSNLSWFNDDWPQGNFGVVGENDTETVFDFSTSSIVTNEYDYAVDENNNPLVYA